MYIKSSSEPPEQPDVNSKNGLRGGFPIKINGYALGSQENLNEIESDEIRSNYERCSSVFGPRVRSRQNSVSRIYETIEKKDDNAFFAPFGPSPGPANTSGLKNKQNNFNQISNRILSGSVSDLRNISLNESSSSSSIKSADIMSSMNTSHTTSDSSMISNIECCSTPGSHEVSEIKFQSSNMATNVKSFRLLI